ncbi:MAG: ATP-binding protein, partial [Candidatus Velthaea sp.]
MILRRVELKHFRRHNRRVEFRLDERMTIVHGPNEAGKSTLFQALEYAFFRRSNSAGADIETLAPWDTRGLAPTVIVDFSHEGAEYRLEKWWGPRSGTQLSTLDAAGRATPFIGTDADDFVTEIFCGDPPGRGSFSGFQGKHLGLAQLLFAPQGRIPNLGDPRDLALNTNAQARLSQAIGAAGQTEREALIADRIKKAYGEIFKADGQPRKAAQSPALAERLTELDAEIECRAAGVSDLEEFARALRDAELLSAARSAAAVEAQKRVQEERPRFRDAVK